MTRVGFMAGFEGDPSRLAFVRKIFRIIDNAVISEGWLRYTAQPRRSGEGHIEDCAIDGL